MNARSALAGMFLIAASAAAQDFSARALLSVEHYKTGNVSRNGFRQTYDLGLDRALTGNSRIRIFFRSDDFRGTTGGVGRRATIGARQLQPGGELSVSTLNSVAVLRSELFETISQTNGERYDRALRRSLASLHWTPVGLPAVRLLGQRNATTDTASTVQLVDEAAMVSTDYAWRGAAVTLSDNYTRSADARVGYERTATSQSGAVSYAFNGLGGKLSATAETFGQRMSFAERGTSAGAASVPVPVRANHAYGVVDETPLDSRDHPRVEVPALIDGDLDHSAPISLGPSGVSFQNLELDIGHVDRVDEIRVVVRDELGNPLRNGGGPVAWDAYTSDDGMSWRLLTSQVSFNAALSYYSVSFDAIDTRWVKVVNFGVNAEPTFVTELQAFYHRTIAAGEKRRGSQDGFNASTSITGKPAERVTLTYTGFYSAISQELALTGRTATTDLEHRAAVRYEVTRWLALRGQYTSTQLHNFAGQGADGAKGYGIFAEFQPAPQLLVSLESTRLDETVQQTPFVLETLAAHSTAYVVRALQVSFDAGEQTQTISADGASSRRYFATFSSNAQLTRRLRMMVAASLQEMRAGSQENVVQLLGARRDDRISAEFIWRAGRELSVASRFGYASGLAASGVTQRYHVDWFPFGDGTVSLATSYDDDIDPVLNRRAKRLLFNPRWMMNRFATFDVNYISVSSTYGSTVNRQRSLFATLTLTR